MVCVCVCVGGGGCYLAACRMSLSNRDWARRNRGSENLPDATTKITFGPTMVGSNQIDDGIDINIRIKRGVNMATVIKYVLK